MRTNWKEVWYKKGESNTTNPQELDGFEKTSINPLLVCKAITKCLNIKPTDSLLEVGCGAGMLAQHFTCKYKGVDFSETLIAKHKELFEHDVSIAEANKLPFKNNSFDYCIAYSVFQYFPNKGYSKKVINEMQRISTKGIFIGDLPLLSHDKNHLLFDKSQFMDYNTTSGYYNQDRFNVYKNETP